MLGLLRDWVLDPVALLFVASLLLILMLVFAAKRRLSRRYKGRSSGSRSSGRRRFLTFPLILLIGAWALLFELVSAPIFVNPLVNQLEKLHYSELECDSGSHVVLLSGGVNSWARSENNFEKMSHATFVRASEAFRIMEKEPNAKLIVSGGVLYRIPEARVIASYLKSLSVPAESLVLEDQSRNTHENAVNVARILKDSDVNGPVRLISSALHMPRAVRSFELALEGSDITICPISVDYKGLRVLQIYGWVPQSTALVKFDLFIHELVALLVYRIKGWI